MEFTHAMAVQEAYDAWVIGAERTRRFPDFASWFIYSLQGHGFEVRG